jgi:hypothetical protein
MNQFAIFEKGHEFQAKIARFNYLSKVRSCNMYRITTKSLDGHQATDLLADNQALDEFFKQIYFLYSAIQLVEAS